MGHVGAAVEFALVRGQPDNAVIASDLPQILPLRSPHVAEHVRKIALLGTGRLPVLATGPAKEVALVCNKRIGRTLAQIVRNPAAVLPHLAAGVAIDVTGFGPVSKSIGLGRVEVAVVGGEGRDIGIGRLQDATVLPGLLHGVVDAEMEVAAVAVGVVAGRTGRDVEVEAPALDRVELADNVSDHIGMPLFETYPCGDGELFVAEV